MTGKPLGEEGAVHAAAADICTICQPQDEGIYRLSWQEWLLCPSKPVTPCGRLAALNAEGKGFKGFLGSRTLTEFPTRGLILGASSKLTANHQRRKGSFCLLSGKEYLAVGQGGAVKGAVQICICTHRKIPTARPADRVRLLAQWCGL